MFSEDNGNDPVFLLTREAGTIVVRQQGMDYFDTSGSRIPVDLKTDAGTPGGFPPRANTWP